MEVRAFRGTRRSSVYRGYALTGAALTRIVEVADRSGLPVLASLAERGPHELDKPAARRLADEATSIRAEATLLELDGDLTALAELAGWCGRARTGAWLRVEPR